MIERDDNIPPYDELLAEVDEDPRDCRAGPAGRRRRAMSDFARQQAAFQRGILSGDDTVLG